MTILLLIPEVPETYSLVKVPADDGVPHTTSAGYYVIAAGPSKQGSRTWQEKKEKEREVTNRLWSARLRTEHGYARLTLLLKGEA